VVGTTTGQFSGLVVVEMETLAEAHHDMRKGKGKVMVAMGSSVLLKL
jgi:hypothetical protein